MAKNIKKLKYAILYDYPPEQDGLSLQGHMLYLGLRENKEDVMPCNLSSEFQKEWMYKYFKPDVAIGVGYWNYTPDIITHPKQFGVIPVPWLVADGWVANYHSIIGSLPLVLTTSDWVKKTYARDGVKTKNFVPVPIGIDTHQFRPIPSSDSGVRIIRKSLGVKENELMILTAGGDVTSKGAQEVLQALKIVDKKFKNWKYICKVYGGPSADQHYENEARLINELGASKAKVRYLEGPLSPDFMPYLLNAADIYAAPSRLEGFGMVQVEAQACGTPVISINEMGPKETVKHNETGFLAKVAKTVDLTEEWAYTHMGFKEDQKVKFSKPKTFEYRADPVELADYILKLATDKSLRTKMGQAARRHAIKSFEYHHIASTITDLIREKLSLG